jgi:BarA-like signal transduction histidine kinase
MSSEEKNDFDDEIFEQSIEATYRALQEEKNSIEYDMIVYELAFGKKPDPKMTREMLHQIVQEINKKYNKDLYL